MVVKRVIGLSGMVGIVAELLRGFPSAVENALAAGAAFDRDSRNNQKWTRRPPTIRR